MLTDRFIIKKLIRLCILQKWPDIITRIYVLHKIMIVRELMCTYRKLYWWQNRPLVQRGKHSVSNAHSASTVESEVEPEVKSEVEPEVETEVEPEVKSEVEPEVEPEVESEVEPQVESEVEPEVKPEVESEVKPEVESEVKSEAEPEVEP